MSSDFKNGINQSAIYAIKNNGEIKINSDKLDNILTKWHNSSVKST